MFRPKGLIPLLPDLFRIDLGLVNAFLITGEDPCLIDTGYEQSAPIILNAIAAAGLAPSEIAHILVTHHHPDHAGGLAALRHATGASVWMHPADAALVRRGIGLRDLHPAPGPLNHFLYHALIGRGSGSLPPAEVDEECTGGTIAPEGGLEVIPTPGHSRGHLAFRWTRYGGVLFAGDVASNIPSLRLSIVYEDFALGRRTLRALGELDFAVACFGHGPPLLTEASNRFASRWPAVDAPSPPRADGV